LSAYYEIEMANRILRTILFTCLGLGICLIGGFVVLIFALADPMPTGGVSIENRSRDLVTVSTRLETSSRKMDRCDSVQPGESISIDHKHKDRDIRYTFDIVRIGSTGRKTSHRYTWEGGNQDERLVLTDANKLEEHRWDERLPLVVK